MSKSPLPDVLIRAKETFPGLGNEGHTVPSGSLQAVRLRWQRNAADFLKEDLKEHLQGTLSYCPYSEHSGNRCTATIAPELPSPSRLAVVWCFANANAKLLREANPSLSKSKM